MHEGLTLEKQRQFEAERGWKPGYAALCYSVTETTIYRTPAGARSVLDLEVLIGTRISGAPDCLKRTSCLWGSYVKPTDQNAPTAAHNAIRGYFNAADVTPVFAGIIGPWVYRATAKVLTGGCISMSILDIPGEVTPFQAMLFKADARGLKVLPGEGTHEKVKADTRWVSLRDLLDQYGGDPDFMYWSIIIPVLCGHSLENPFFSFYPSSSDYEFKVPSLML